MPVLKELSEAVQSDLKRTGKPPLPGEDTPVADDFEQWLSYLIDTPPWLSRSDRLRNQAAFYDVAASVNGVLTERQLAAAQTDPPDWLTKLVGYWEYTSATVITFNYDTLVELAWLKENRDHWWARLYPIPLTPIAQRTSAVLGGDDYPRDGMRLLKPHGSLNWSYSGPDSPPNDLVYDAGIKGGAWSVDGISPFYEGAEEMAADLEPMIVPPVAVKNPYYGNRTLQAIWRLTAEALAGAEELVIMGFGMPISDQLVSSLLATTLRKDATIVPVDFGFAVVDRLRQVLRLPDPDPRLVTSFAGRGASAVPDWVEMFATAP